MYSKYLHMGFLLPSLEGEGSKNGNSSMNIDHRCSYGMNMHTHERSHFGEGSES